jgi:hypothetical protein
MTVDVPSQPSRRRQIIGGVAIVLVALLIAGIVIMRQRQLAAQGSAPAGVCAPMANAAVSIIPPGVTLPVMVPAGEPRVVATINGDPLYAAGLEMQVALTQVNQQRASQLAYPGLLPPNVRASLARTSNQIRHDALTQMIQECLLLQEGKRLGLTAALPAAQALAREQLQVARSIPASDPGRISFETYLQANHLTEQTFLTDPRILHGYANVLTIAAVKQHIRTGLPPGVSPEAGISAYIQHLWQSGTVRVFLPAQLGW